MALAAVSLDDKYDLARQRVLVSGSQAIARLLLMQQARDRRSGANTAGYVSGHRGAPLAGLDTALWRAAGVLQPAGIVFSPGINEELAATALWGAQQAELRGEGRFDGVFGLWYGAGPGVDRSGDALKHANLAGTSPWGGVLALAGDDHACAFSTAARQSDHAFVDAMIPVLSPAGVQEILDYGLFGYALSRYAGIWVGLKCVADTVQATATVDGALDRVATVIPGGFRMPPGGLAIRTRDDPLAQEERLHAFKIPAALAFLRANAPDRVVLSGGRQPKIGIVAAGKSYLDVLQALDVLGIDAARADDLGLRLIKVACTWPLEAHSIRGFAQDLQTIVVVEEKRGLIEGQIKEILYGTANQPAVIGKTDEEGRWLFPSKGELDTNRIAIAIGARLIAGRNDERLARRVAALRKAEEVLAGMHDVAGRSPAFCAGCPYNIGTAVPEGARAYAGTGCALMVEDMPGRNTEGHAQMGGEGASWIGEAPFSTRGHIFQNLGDGSYIHSGSLAVRAAAAAGVSITFKILFNDAAALTGGQKPDGSPSVERIAAAVLAEGAGTVVVVSEEPKRYRRRRRLPSGVTVHHRDELDSVQRQLAGNSGVSVLIYDQTCAVEKRRGRKRGDDPDAGRQVVINERVCDGCGDCGVQSNCVAIQPVETEFGRKRVIDRSVCNKDFSCLKGFCPSFVTVHGAVVKPAAALAEDEADLPDPPSLPALAGSCGIVVAGIGGTGVVTVGALLAMAAHMEGKAAAVVDRLGFARMGGPVVSYVRIAPTPEDIRAVAIAAGGADLLIGCDAVVAGSASVLAAVDPGRTSVFINTHETYPAAFTHDPDFTLPMRRILQAITARAGAGNSRFIEASGIVTALLGDAIATNVFMLGLAWQAGAVPLSHFAILKAIEANGVDVAMNKAAFAWGRRAATEPEAVAEIAAGRGRRAAPMAESVDQLVARRIRYLTEYQDERYAQRYADAVAAMREAEARIVPGRADLTEAVALNLFRLMAVKDEYEVARLFTDGSFERQLAGSFDRWERLEYHVAPPLFAKRDRATGRLKTQSYGPGIMRLLRLFARLRRVRGSWRDPFGYSSERRMERQLLAEYEAALATIREHLAPANHHLAVALARYPDKIRGFGPVKAEAIGRVLPDAAARRAAFLAGGASVEAGR